MKALKGFFLIVYAALIILLFFNFDTSLLVWVSFFVNAIVLLCITIYHLYFEKDYSPFLSSFIVFTFLFFIAAPITQISSFYNQSTPKFVHFFPYKESLVLYANFLILLFNVCFITFYIRFKKKISFRKREISLFRKKTLPFSIAVILCICLLIFFTSYNFVIEEFSRPSWLKSSNSVMVLLLWKKFLFFIPLSGICLCFQYFNKTLKNKSNYKDIIVFLVLFIAILFWFKNPLIEKRNALGPIYITLIFLFIPRLLNNNVKILSFLFFSMIILFPLTAILTHSDASFLEIYNNPMILIKEMKGGGITEAFTTLNYDAFSNITVTLELISKEGFSFGYQLLGGVLFFFPRSIWTSKPISSGELVGDYLVENYQYNFTNLSNSFLSESFLNFGLLGIIIFAIVLAYMLNYFIFWLKSENYLKKTMAFYFSIHLIFFLRGDFTNGFSYYVGPLLAVLLIPWLVETIIKELLLLKKTNIGNDC
jgi:hypothetical protein